MTWGLAPFAHWCEFTLPALVPPVRVRHIFLLFPLFQFRYILSHFLLYRPLYSGYVLFSVSRTLRICFLDVPSQCSFLFISSQSLCDVSNFLLCKNTFPGTREYLLFFPILQPFMVYPPPACVPISFLGSLSFCFLSRPSMCFCLFSCQITFTPTFVPRFASGT